MPIYTFVEMTAVPDCNPTGAYQEYLADSEEQAIQYALYSFELADVRAMLGRTGRIIYPHGSVEDPAVWVLLARNSQRRFYTERGLEWPNQTPGGGLKGTGKGTVRASRMMAAAIETAEETFYGSDEAD